MNEKEQAVEIAIEAKKRAETCYREVMNVLTRYNCVIDPVLVISGLKGIMPNWGINAIPNVPKGLKIAGN